MNGCIIQVYWSKNKWHNHLFKNMFDDIINTQNIDLNLLNKDNYFCITTCIVSEITIIILIYKFPNLLILIMLIIIILL